MGNQGAKGTGCVGNQPTGRSGREAKRAAARPGLGGSYGAQARTHLRQTLRADGEQGTPIAVDDVPFVYEISSTPAKVRLPLRRTRN